MLPYSIFPVWLLAAEVLVLEVNANISMHMYIQEFFFAKLPLDFLFFSTSVC